MSNLCKESVSKRTNHELQLAILSNYSKLAFYDKAKQGYSELLEELSETGNDNNAQMKLQVLNGLALVLMNQGSFSEARQHLEKAISIAETGNLQSEDAVSTLITMAQLESDLSRFSESRASYTRAKSMAEKLGKDGAESEATILSGLSLLSFYTGDFDLARRLATESLSSRKTLLGEESLEFASSLVNDAFIHEHTQSEIVEIFRRVLNIRSKILGNNGHPLVGETLLLLSPYIRPYSQSAQYCLTAMHSADGVLDHNSPFISDCLSDLAQSYLSAYKLKPALERNKIAFEMRARIYAEDSLQVANSMAQLAELKTRELVLKSIVLKNKEAIQCPEADELMKKAIAIYEKKLGPKNTTGLAYFYGIYSWMKDLSKDYRSAVAIRKNYLPTLVACHGAKSPYVRTEKIALIRDYLELGESDNAKSLLESVLEQELEKSGANGYELGMLFSEVSKLSKLSSPPQIVLPPTLPLEPNFAKSKPTVTGPEEIQLMILQSWPTEMDYKLEKLKHDLAELEGRKSKLLPELYSLERGLHNKERQFGDDSPMLVDPLLDLAAFYTREAKHQMAASMYKRSIEIVNEGLGTQHPMLIKILNMYADDLEKSGDTIAAAEQRAKAKAIPN